MRVTLVWSTVVFPKVRKYPEIFPLGVSGAVQDILISSAVTMTIDILGADAAAERTTYE